MTILKVVVAAAAAVLAAAVIRSIPDLKRYREISSM